MIGQLKYKSSKFAIRFDQCVLNGAFTIGSETPYASPDVRCWTFVSAFLLRLLKKNDVMVNAECGQIGVDRVLPTHSAAPMASSRDSVTSGELQQIGERVGGQDGAEWCRPQLISIGPGRCIRC